MKDYIQHHPWQVIEDRFRPEYHEVSESLFSLGNGRFGIRGNFEEDYSGKSLRGAYFAGVYFPDPTRVGWWKNGYPDYFAKVLNGVNWIGVHILINGVALDLANQTPENFSRVLDMREGILHRSFVIRPAGGGRLHFRFERFCHLGDPDTAAIQIEVRSEGFTGKVELIPYLDFDVHNRDANYGDQFWEGFKSYSGDKGSWVSAITKKTGFTVSSYMLPHVTLNDNPVAGQHPAATATKVADNFAADLHDGDILRLTKYVVNLTNLYIAPEAQQEIGHRKLSEMVTTGYKQLRQNHIKAWENIWDMADIEIEGSIPAQQGIRFNIFHLWQTYTGEDPRMNIGPKGFTGEKYGGSTYWDTEAYCIPFYLGTAESQVARNLLVYRYLHLPKAIENAEKLGFTGGAALYPMVTMTGEECHNEWEITFEEIHRNGAIVYAIYDYIRYTGDAHYILEGGLEVLIGVARFWAQRVNFSEDKQAWVMLGVTGPNEYENNVNNNWYTNYIARWCLQFALKEIDITREHHPDVWADIQARTCFKNEETAQWKDIADNIYLPFDEDRQVYLQQDGFLDKVLMPVSALPAKDRPLNQKWSWDRILRSCFIKQADVLQGMYFFEDQFDLETIRRHFEFYEPMTVHESSLSPCVHAILAARLGMVEKANEMYLRTARLDLDDYNNDTEDGLHITSMAGTWMAVVRGFAGVRVRDGVLHLAPVLPAGWSGFTFKMHYRGRYLSIEAGAATCRITRLEGEPLEIDIYGRRERV
jgi:maltose phosphorylase